MTINFPRTILLLPYHTYSVAVDSAGGDATSTAVNSIRPMRAPDEVSTSQRHCPGVSAAVAVKPRYPCDLPPVIGKEMRETVSHAFVAVS